MTRLLDTNEPPSAVLCYNDRVAMGAYGAIHERGLAIPDDIAVIGFDNQEVIAAHLRPPLSTMGSHTSTWDDAAPNSSSAV